MKRAEWAAVLLVMSSCGRGTGEVEQGAFEKAVMSASAAPACARVIPVHWSPSWPVPALENGKLVYWMFFFGRDGSPGTGFEFHRPEADAVLSAEGNVLACRARAEKAAALPAVKPERGGAAELEARARRERAQYARIERVASLYAAKTPLAPGDRAAVEEFASEFKSLSVSGHADAYRALSPDFWDWIDRSRAAR